MTNAYPNYKPSGIDWLGDIPAHWEVKKLKYLLQSVKNDSPAGTLRIAVENIESRTGRLVNLSDEKVMQGSATGFRPDDVVFNKLRPYLAKVYYATEQGGSFGELLILRSKGELYGKYTFYKLLSDEFISKVDSSTEGTKMPRANWDEYIAHLKIQYPPLAEQIAITEYLDNQTAQIDDLVGQKQELIRLLQEERAGIINDAVTQGLNHRAPRKESGLPWLGKIPAHWKVIPFKRITHRVEVGIAEAATHAYQNEGIPILRATNVKNGKIKGQLIYISDAFAEKNSSKKIFKNDIITVRTGNAGQSAVVPAYLNECQCFTMLITTLSQKADSYFYNYMLNSYYGTTYFDVTAWGTAQRNISVPILREMPILIPPLKEQTEIVNYLDLETERIDKTIQTIEQEINLLTEYRSALISEVVTGKQKVN